MEEELKAKDGGIRQIIELAISCGRTLQSDQTGYVHHYYPLTDEGENHTIPLYENFLFALSLMRSKAADNVLEGKGIVERLLQFQCMEPGFSQGNFPIYLHDYPQCKDRLIGAYLLAPFYWILKQFHQVLGADLRQKLEARTLAMLTHCLRTHREKPAPYHMAIRIAAGAQAIGELLGRPEITQEGKSLMEELLANPDMASWSTPASIGDLLVALQMVHPSIIDSPWKPFWDHIASTWHIPSCCYIGPSIKEFQYGEEPLSALYDLYMGYLSQQYSYRSFVVSHYQLHGILIQPTTDRILTPQYPLQAEGEIAGSKWRVYQEQAFAYSLIEKQGLNPAVDKTFAPFKMIWGDRNGVHTFVCQGGNISGAHYQANKEHIILDLDVTGPADVEDKEKQRELAFYIDRHEALEFSVKGEQSTTFSLGDPIEARSGPFHVKMTVHQAEGNGRFFGHLMRGNRPSQTKLKGENRFQAFDVQLFLRTLMRHHHSKFRVEIAVTSEGKAT